MTISAMTMVVGLAGKCRKVPAEPTDKEQHILWKQVSHLHWNCDSKTEYNDLATLFYNTEAA